jgi:hypothetical protein
MNVDITTKPFHTDGRDWSYVPAEAGITNTTTAVTIKAAAGAGLKNYITAIQIATSAALQTATVLAIRDGAAGTVLWRLPLTTTVNTGGFSFTFPTPLRGSDNKLLEVVTLTANGTGAIYFNAQGYTGV